MNEGIFHRRKIIVEEMRILAFILNLKNLLLNIFIKLTYAKTVLTVDSREFTIQRKLSVNTPRKIP